MDLTATDITTSSAIIEWRVPFVAYTTEEYVVLYGTDENALDQMSDIVTGGTDTSAENQIYSVTLDGLETFTIYYFQVRAENTYSFTLSMQSQFTTQQDGKITSCRSHFPRGNF